MGFVAHENNCFSLFFLLQNGDSHAIGIPCVLNRQASIDDPDAWRTVTLTDVNDFHTTTTIRRRPRRRQWRPSNGKMMIMFGLSTAMMIRKLTSFKKTKRPSAL
ncbi:hypothetical protein C1H46_045132 [Malus baccata]|uniref:Uncharacterized protein n=1 Tax=Malus baccata TaxID=106549 RepID=A0A540K529_MALBA|nr:hypothetical protein C1H46_045132 [Malus baccata]